MKKFLLTVLFAALLLGLFAREELVWCKRLLTGEATLHTIQDGEYFSKLSQSYYGTAEYWRELALINRAPNADLVFPGETVIIPGPEAIKELHAANSLTGVNTIVESQQRLIAMAKDLLNNEKSPGTPTAAEPQVSSPAAQTHASELDDKAVAGLHRGGFSLLLVIGLVFAAVLLTVLTLFTINRVKEKKQKQDTAKSRDKKQQDSESYPPRKEHALVN